MNMVSLTNVNSNLGQASIKIVFIDRDELLFQSLSQVLNPVYDVVYKSEINSSLHEMALEGPLVIFVSHALASAHQLNKMLADNTLIVVMGTVEEKGVFDASDMGEKIFGFLKKPLNLDVLKKMLSGASTALLLAQLDERINVPIQELSDLLKSSVTSERLVQSLSNLNTLKASLGQLRLDQSEKANW
jgi:hypothetical protein